jgi:hypothetical protein
MRKQARLACHSVAIVQKSQDVIAQFRQALYFSAVTIALTMVLYRDAIFMTNFFWSLSSQREFRCRAQLFKTILCSHRSNKRQEDKLSADWLSDSWPNYGFLLSRRRGIVVRLI